MIKAELRKKYLQKRETLSKDEVLSKSEKKYLKFLFYNLNPLKIKRFTAFCRFLKWEKWTQFIHQLFLRIIFGFLFKDLSDEINFG